VTAYVISGYPGIRTVTPIDTATGKPGKAIKVGNASAAIAITPDGKTAYVVSTLSDTVTPIQTATNKALKPIKVGNSGPTAITPNGKTAYVADAFSDNVTPTRTRHQHRAQGDQGGKLPRRYSDHPGPGDRLCRQRHLWRRRNRDPDPDHHQHRWQGHQSRGRARAHRDRAVTTGQPGPRPAVAGLGELGQRQQT
jgi:YVTN family beta-propeller protein